MTAQSPERMILDGRPRALYADPLYRLLKSRRLSLAKRGEGWSTSNYRGYCGTWQVVDGRLYLVHLNMMWPDEGVLPMDLRRELLRGMSASDFPAFASWFNGRLRLAIGRRLIYSHQGWSHWFERERVMTFVGGKVVRDREVDTQRMLERWLKRNPHVETHLDGSNTIRLGPMTGFDTDDDDWTIDWWPEDFAQPAA